MRTEKFNLCKSTKKLLTLITLLTLGVGQMWADNTIVVGVAGSNPNNYTVKVEPTIGDGGTKWGPYELTKAGITFEGKKLYVGTFNEKYGGIDNLDLHYYNGATWKEKKTPYSSWTNSSTFQNRIFNYDASGGAKYSDVSMTNGARVYFDASTWEETGIKLVTGHANHQKYYALSAVTNTKLYYGTNTDTWSDAMGFGIVGGTSRSGTQDEWLTDVSDKAAEYTGWKNYGLTATSTNNAYLVVPAGKAGEQPTINYYATAYSSLNSTQTIKYAVGVNGGTPAELTSGYVPADIAISSYKFASGTYNSVSSSSGSATLSQGGSKFSATVTAARTATTTYTVSNIHGDYSFLGWYSAANGGTLLSSELSYTFYPTSATTAYARFSKENNHTVTISRFCTSTSTEINNTSAKIGEVTYSSIEAPDIHGYSFVNWSLGSGLAKHASDAVTSNPIRVITNNSGSGYTMTANYTEVLTTDWKLIGDNSTNSPFGDNYSYASGKAMSKKSGASATDKAYKTLDMTHTGTWGFKVATASGNSYTYGWGTGDNYITFNRSKSGTQQDVYTGEQHELKFNPDALGEYEFEIDYTAAKCSVKVTFPTAYQVNFGVRTGGTSASASYSSTSFSTGTKVQEGKSVTFTQSAATGYNFEGWYNASSGGTRQSTSSSWTTTVGSATLNAYANYTAKNYTGGVLDKNGGSSDGSYSVTYNATSITPSAPTKTGYHVEGYYTNAACTTKVASPAGVLEKDKAGYTDADGHWNYDGIKKLYAKWEANTYTGANNLNKTIGGAHGQFTATYNATTIAINTTPTKTGYDVEGYYKTYSDSPSDTWTTLVATSAGALQASTGYTDGSKRWTNDGNVTLYTKWSAHTYTVTLTPGEGGSGSNGTMTVDYDATTYKTFSHSITQTGYHIEGWYDNGAKRKVLNPLGTFAGDNVTDYITSGKWTKASNCTLQAWWEANTYTVTLDVDEDHKGDIDGATESQSVTFNAATSTVSNLPTAENGYGLEGYYTEQNGAGTKLIDYDGTWIASVTGYTDGSKNWIHDGNVTLYAYYKKAEITGITFSPGTTVAPSTDLTPTTVTATPTIYPTPIDPTIICWKLLRANGNLMDPQPAFTSTGVGNAVSFPAPKISGSYKVACILRTGAECGTNTVLDSVVADLVVAGAHTVTIQYQDGSGRTLKDTIHITARPLEWTTAGTITPPTITGYTFARWDAGDGVSIRNGDSDPVTTTTTESIQIKAVYDGTLTAVYNKKRMIYFYNTLNWESVYVYFYKNDTYWESTGLKRGSGASTTSTWTNTPYSEGKHGQMQPVSEGSKIYYFDAEAAGVNASYDDVVFTEANQHGYEFFYATKAARRGDYKTSLPMYVPLADQTPTEWNSTKYYDKGYWMNYPENTGYTLKIYNSWTATKETAAVREYPFPFSEDKKMPLQLDVEFNNSRSEYWFMVYRNDGVYYGNEYTYNQNYNTDQVISSGDNKCKLVTSAPGVYSIKLTYHDDGGNPKAYNYYIDVDFPVAVNDYRIVYKDNATWSNGAHGASWYHPSDVIVHLDGEATEAKKDIVSFYIAKGAGITTSMKFQYASAISDAGAITWTDVPSGTIDLSSFSGVITKAGVYNFHINQPTTGGIAVESVEPYTGTYYIRTDCAGNTKWDSYTAQDHQMTYSDYSFSQANDPYSHYYCHWVTAGTNVKFVIANDYSVCVSDTLEGDTYTTASLAANANIRFMYNESTNKISRAYIAGSGNITDRFLVLEGDAKMYDEDGHALTGDYQDHDKWGTKLGTDNQVILHDDENFVYERTIMVNPQARAKLTAKYNNNVQYFKGSEGSFAEGTTVQLLGGDASATKYKMRIVYDFKTNRLVTAYIPGDEISGTVAINADVMLIREHQEEGQQITFANESSELSQVKTVYGVMRFNRWTLNNRANPEDHDKDHSTTDDLITTWHPLLGPGSMKSVYERALYWISFPFDVNLSDVFGFGTYGTHWILMDYNGAERARIGYWKDNDEGFWEYIWDRRGVRLKAGKGYVLALELELMKATDRTFWSNEIQEVELFFPSISSTTGTIKQTAVDVNVPEHACTIDRRTDKTVADWNNDRRVADSHWNIIGVPSYANYGIELTDGSSNINWQVNPKVNGLPFLYEWNSNDNTYTVQSGTKYNFKAMHAYYVQYGGLLHWSLASATPAIVARRTYAEESEDVELKIELQQNEKMIDQTFVKLSNDEEVSANFAFGEDMDKEFNAGKANVYTFIEGYIPSAGNALPMSEQTTIVPVGVSIPTAGEYTFAIPDGTEGVGVILVDNVANTRTNLSALDYTVNLTTGTHDGRFVLEISPIHNATTGIEAVSDEGLEITGARKMIIDQKLYIVKDGKLFDATGKRVE